MGAGAVVTKDVAPRVVVVGNPARVLRDVPADELLGNSETHESGPRLLVAAAKNSCVFPDRAELMRPEVSSVSITKAQAGRPGSGSTLP